MDKKTDSYIIRPNPADPRLTERVTGIDQTGAKIETSVTVERALTIFLNSQEIVTAMTIGDYPEYLAVGYLLNQNMLLPDDVVTGVDYDEELAVVVVRTKRKTNYEKKLKKKVQTSGCAQGTVFGDLMEALENVSLPKAKLRTSWLYALTHKINTTPSLYLEAGAIHGCVLAKEDQPLVYMEDVGRHNAVDKIAGWMFKEKVKAADKIFYTTGRLTSEMVIKTVRMGIPILISRSGFTAWGVELARKANLTLIGRARGKRFVALAGEDRIVFDQDLALSKRKAPSTAARPPCMMSRFLCPGCVPHSHLSRGERSDRHKRVYARLRRAMAIRVRSYSLSTVTRLAHARNPLPRGERECSPRVRSKTTNRTADIPIPPPSAWCSPAAWRAAWAAATRRASRSAAFPSSTACWRRCRGNASA